MSNINKHATELLIANGQLVADTLRHLANNEIDSDYFAIVSESENGTEIEQELAITDYAMQAAGTVGELVKALESAQELVELQRFKLERQAEDLHQAKSLESIHRDKRFEVEREFSSYKDNAERNTSRLAQEVCRLEDELEAAQRYAKERDEENQDLMLTVGRLRVERETSEAEMGNALCELLPGVQYMDPPDGGNVTPLEQVRRMVTDYRERIAELETRELVAAGIITKVGK